jgi:two-component system sensor kinase FixL
MKTEIYKDILLELAFAISGEFDLQQLLKHCIPLFLRKLNCTLAAVIRISSDQVSTECTVPHAAALSPAHREVVDRLVESHRFGQVGPVSTIATDHGVYYGFRLEGFGLLVLGRERRFDDFFVKELLSPCRMLARACLACVEVERRVEAELAEKRTRESMVCFQALFEQAMVGVAQIDTVANRFAKVNQRLCDIFGYTRGDMGELDSRTIIQSEISGFDRAGEASLEIAMERRCRRKDGTPVWVNLRVSPMCLAGAPSAYCIVIVQDITEKHAAEQKQAALLQKVAQINEELSHFAYVVSHDLKAPLRGVKLITEWLCADYADKLGDDAKEQLGLLQSRVARMHDLIDGILQYSRVGRVQQENEDVDLNRLIPSLIDGIAPPEHIRILVEPGLPVMECGKTRISQVFQNLLSNAVKFMDKPAGEVRVGCVEDDEFWRFSVSDNGSGIEAKYFDRIFRLFQTLTPRDEFESTGVGLAVVKKIVELYGGRIWVESEVGRGSTFFFTMPKRMPSAALEDVNAALPTDVSGTLVPVG